MNLAALCVGDVVRFNGHERTFLGASIHPTEDEFVLATWLSESNAVFCTTTKWNAEVGNLISYRNDNLRHLDYLTRIEK